VLTEYNGANNATTEKNGTAEVTKQQKHNWKGKNKRRGKDGRGGGAAGSFPGQVIGPIKFQCKGGK